MGKGYSWRFIVISVTHLSSASVYFLQAHSIDIYNYQLHPSLSSLFSTFLISPFYWLISPPVTFPTISSLLTYISYISIPFIPILTRYITLITFNISVAPPYSSYTYLPLLFQHISLSPFHWCQYSSFTLIYVVSFNISLAFHFYGHIISLFTHLFSFFLEHIPYISVRA